jgi:hypothetical protein
MVRPRSPERCAYWRITFRTFPPCIAHLTVASSHVSNLLKDYGFRQAKSRRAISGLDVDLVNNAIDILLINAIDIEQIREANCRTTKTGASAVVSERLRLLSD